MNNWRYRRSWDRSGWFCSPIASGVSSGPSFFASLRTGGRAVLLVIVTLLLAAAVAVVAGRFAGLNPI